MNNKLTLTTLALIIITGMLIAPEACISVGYNSLKLCVNALIPTLLPFFICVKILYKTGFATKICRPLKIIMRPVFNLPGEAAFAFIMGIISGYPMGAKCAVQMLDDNICTKKEAERIICFCNNSGPLFIIGSIGTIMLGNKTAGTILFVSHLFSAVTLGIVYSIKRTPETIHFKKQIIKTSGTLTEAVTEGIDLILYVCGFVVFFNILATVFDNFGIFKLLSFPLTIFGADQSTSNAIISGIIEMTGGISKLSAISHLPLKLPLISFLTGFGGMAVLFQVIGVFEPYGLNKAKFIGAKFLQGMISFIYTYILLKLPITIQTSAFTKTNFSFTGALTCGVFLTLISIMILVSASALITLTLKFFERISNPLFK